LELEVIETTNDDAMIFLSNGLICFFEEREMWFLTSLVFREHFTILSYGRARLITDIVEVPATE
jgi:hypothetical protein